MKSRTRYRPAVVFTGGENVARAARDAGADTTADILPDLDDRGFRWTPAPVRTASAPEFVPTVPLAELPQEATAASRRWAAR